jgi:hypothetical protein
MLSEVYGIIKQIKKDPSSIKHKVLKAVAVTLLQKFDDSFPINQYIFRAQSGQRVLMKGDMLSGREQRLKK